MSDKKRYLGDSVYIDVDDGGRLVLTTENGYAPSNTIVLEIEVIDALLSYLIREDHLPPRIQINKGEAMLQAMQERDDC